MSIFWNNKFKTQQTLKNVMKIRNWLWSFYLIVSRSLSYEIPFIENLDSFIKNLKYIKLHFCQFIKESCFCQTIDNNLLKKEGEEGRMSLAPKTFFLMFQDISFWLCHLLSEKLEKNNTSNNLCNFFLNRKISNSEKILLYLLLQINWKLSQRNSNEKSCNEHPLRHKNEKIKEHFLHVNSESHYREHKLLFDSSSLTMYFAILW